MSQTTHIAIETRPDTRWIYEVSPAYAGTRREIEDHGVRCAARYEGVWMISGTCRIRDTRYLAILEATPVLQEQGL